MKKKLAKVLFPSLLITALLCSGHKAYGVWKESVGESLLEQNVEALSKTETGPKCSNGCKDIGWGWNKILECDCNYDHFSSCNNWGC